MTAQDQEAVAAASVPGGQPKDVRVVKVIIDVAQCYREHKFPSNDPRYCCHLGLKKLDFGICPNCVWFSATTKPRTKMLSGGEAMAVAGFLRTIRETHDTELGATIPAQAPGAAPA